MLHWMKLSSLPQPLSSLPQPLILCWVYRKYSVELRKSSYLIHWKKLPRKPQILPCHLSYMDTSHLFLLSSNIASLCCFNFTDQKTKRTKNTLWVTSKNLHMVYYALLDCSPYCPPHRSSLTCPVFQPCCSVLHSWTCRAISVACSLLCSVC